MKKISLKNLEILAIGQLTREQMKDILGGGNYPVTPGDCQYDESCSTKCSQGKYCTTCCNA